mmetsp:Transcript_25376/g.50863  ORF Transcript_25376/g.50863 Transcript_25376/m.50863 type:complete len:256 (-) Transcript_25376:784-1551(-)
MHVMWLVIDKCNRNLVIGFRQSLHYPNISSITFLDFFFLVFFFLDFFSFFATGSTSLSCTSSITTSSLPPADSFEERFGFCNGSSEEFNPSSLCLLAALALSSAIFLISSALCLISALTPSSVISMVSSTATSLTAWSSMLFFFFLLLFFFLADVDVSSIRRLSITLAILSSTPLPFVISFSSLFSCCIYTNSPMSSIFMLTLLPSSPLLPCTSDDCRDSICISFNSSALIPNAAAASFHLRSLTKLLIFLVRSS